MMNVTSVTYLIVLLSIPLAQTKNASTPTSRQQLSNQPTNDTTSSLIRSIAMTPTSTPIGSGYWNFTAFPTQPPSLSSYWNYTAFPTQPPSVSSRPTTSDHPSNIPSVSAMPTTSMSPTLYLDEPSLAPLIKELAILALLTPIFFICYPCISVLSFCGIDVIDALFSIQF